MTDPESVDEETLAGEGDAGYEPDTVQEPDEVAEDELPDGDSGEFDGASIDEDEAPGEAQPDEPMTREESE